MSSNVHVWLEHINSVLPEGLLPKKPKTRPSSLAEMDGPRNPSITGMPRVYIGNEGLDTYFQFDTEFLHLNFTLNTVHTKSSTPQCTQTVLLTHMCFGFDNKPQQKITHILHLCFKNILLPWFIITILYLKIHFSLIYIIDSNTSIQTYNMSAPIMMK